jgi:hypothetical protein
VDRFQKLVRAFLDNQITALEFETSYISEYRQAAVSGSRIPYAADVLFYGIDAFCADAKLRGPLDIDEAQLREEARAALARWSEPWPPGPLRL